jgi:hypothetical protein
MSEVRLGGQVGLWVSGLWLLRLCVLALKIRVNSCHSCKTVFPLLPPVKISILNPRSSAVKKFASASRQLRRFIREVSGIPMAGAVLKFGRGQVSLFELSMKKRLFKFSVSFLVIALMQMVCSRGAVILKVGGFSDNRSGNISIGEGSYFDEARASLQTNFNAVFTNLDVLAGSNLAGVQLLVLAPGTSHATGATPLSTNEQIAMVNFVLGGGGLLILSDNYSYAGTAVAEEQALLSPFGISGTGTIGGESTATIRVPGAEPLSGGLNGTVNFYTENYPGWITNTGPYATVLASNVVGVALAVIPRGALGPQSGPVAIFSDGNQFSDEGDGAGFFLSNQPLFLNTVRWLISAAPMPNLSANRVGPNSVKVQWPNTGIFKLLQRTNLSAGNWTTNVNAVTAASGTNSITISPGSPNMFFRLMQ